MFRVPDLLGHATVSHSGQTTPGASFRAKQRPGEGLTSRASGELVARAIEAAQVRSFRRLRA